jgi:hypothetical protein
MDKEFYKAEETNCNAFASQIEDTVENCLTKANRFATRCWI